MTLQILTTKLYIPPTRPTTIARPVLIEFLNHGFHTRLTLISAPAGFGKTTLVSEWITQSEQAFAWLSLDARDAEPVRFLGYLLKALQTVLPDFGKDLFDILQTSQTIQVELILVQIINYLAALEQPVNLVLDDYHTLDSKQVDDIIGFLLDHLPHQFHIVIITREDPSFSTARLRARGELIEIRADDLRFTIIEATEFLNQHMGFNLEPEDVSKLEARTEGWIAALQMVAISMRERADTKDFINTLTGSHRYILDYLVDEVLQHQPADTVDFLLHTAILERMCGSLCDALTGQNNGQSMLEILEQKNMLIVPLDDERQWYRYHHLFADVLQVYARKTMSNQIPMLHRRACDWYVMNNQPYEALHHVLIAKDYERAADLIELNWQDMDTNYASAAWISQVQNLPESTIRRYPVLCAGYGWTMLYRGEFEASEQWFKQAEYWLNTDERDEMCVADSFQFEMLPASLNSARAYQAMAHGDTMTTLQLAQQALDFVGDAEHASRTQALALSGLVQWANGELDAADATMSTLIDYMQQTGRIADALELMFVIGDIRMTCGRLHSAYRLYQRGFEMLEAAKGTVLIGMEDLYRGVVDVYREWGDWDTAEQHLMSAEKFGSHAVSRPDWNYRLNITAARLALSQGDFDRALSLVEVAQEHYAPSPIPQVRSALALRTRVWIKQGNLSAAVSWAEENLLDDITYLNEFEHITHARLLLARGKYRELHLLLQRLLLSAQDNNRTGSTIEILILQALAYYADGDLSTALLSLDKALKLAEPEGYIRIFADEGQPMKDLLSASLSDGADAAYIMSLLQHMGANENTKDTPISANDLLIEPLSDREMEVLELVSRGLTNQAIADDLFIAVSTVKKHINNILGKLGVDNRTQAVNRAQELHLL